MSKIVRVTDDNYKIIVQNGGTITLDTTDDANDDTGEVVITGDLTVRGVTTTVESTVTTIKDNIITLNAGESGTGISASLNQQAGIEVDRGTLSKGRWVWDDSISWSAGGDNGVGLWTSMDFGESLHPIRTNGIWNDNSIYFNPGTTGTLSVTNTPDYEEQLFTYVGGNIVDGGGGVVVDDDNIPNVKAVVDYVAFSQSNLFQARIEDGTTTKTFVEAKDFETTGQESKIELGIDGNSVFNIFNNRTELHNIQINENQISTLNDDSTNQDLVLSAGGSGNVRIDDGLIVTATPFQAEDAGAPGSNAPDEGVKLYGDTESTGNTGLYFVNSNSTNDEIISNNRALVYGMLF